jgi:hypothetical protein
MMVSIHVFVLFTALLSALCIKETTAAACPETKLDAIINAAALTCPEFANSFSTLGAAGSKICDNKYCVQLIRDLQAVGVGSCLISTTGITLDQLLDPVEATCVVLNPTLWSGTSLWHDIVSPEPRILELITLAWPCF